LGNPRALDTATPVVTNIRKAIEAGHLDEAYKAVTEAMIKRIAFLRGLSLGHLDAKKSYNGH